MDKVRTVYRFSSAGRKCPRRVTGKPDKLRGMSMCTVKEIREAIREDEVSKTYLFPKSYVSYRKLRVVSTEQRKRARQMVIEKNKTKGD